MELMKKSCALSPWHTLLEHLRILGADKPLALALSGGLDSRFLAHAAQRAGVDLLCLHASGSHMPARESAYARAWAQRNSLPLREVAVDVLSLEGVRDNSRQRCYYCKQYLLAQLREAAPGHVLCDGTNADDLHSHRPGLRALREAGVRSPLADRGLGKARLRELGAATGLEDAEQKASPCLLTRLNYGLTPSLAVLRRVEALEERLEGEGFKDFRLRLCPEPLLQTVPLQDEQRRRALEILAVGGFAHACLREEETIGGFFDR